MDAHVSKKIEEQAARGFADVRRNPEADRRLQQHKGQGFCFAAGRERSTHRGNPEHTAKAYRFRGQERGEGRPVRQDRSKESAGNIVRPDACAAAQHSSAKEQSGIAAVSDEYEPQDREQARLSPADLSGLGQDNKERRYTGRDKQKQSASAQLSPFSCVTCSALSHRIPDEKLFRLDRRLEHASLIRSLVRP